MQPLHERGRPPPLGRGGGQRYPTTETNKMNVDHALERNTPEAEAAIQRGIAADPDTYEVPSADFSKMRKRGATAASEESSAATSSSIGVRADLPAEG
jgi:hypothetical protein